MAKKTTIVSFDDAKKRSRRADAAVQEGRSRSRSGEEPKRANAATPAQERRSSSQSVSRRTRNQGNQRSSRNDAPRKEQGREPRIAAAEAKRDTRRRERTKARAEKMYAKQFAGESAAVQSAPSENAPRAALYEGKMGSTHRRSARMQRSSEAGSPSVKINPAGWFANLPITARSLRIATAFTCIILACAFLYTPAQQYYQAQREHARLAAEYSIIEERNDTLDAQNDVLASDAGMEDAVRQKYGYVKAGEQTAVVTGLSDWATDTSRDSEGIEPAILSSSVKAPEDWYTPLLDTFFGVK